MGTDERTVASYSKYAEQWADRIDSGDNIAQSYLEKPAMYEKLPDLQGKKVLCVGSGTGEECGHMLAQGADQVVGIDIAEGMVDVAKQRHPGVDFLVGDMEAMDFPPRSFDFVYSSLTLAYVEDWTTTLRNINKAMTDDGTFLFSTNHPVKWGAELERSPEASKFMMGYTKYRQTGEAEVTGDYLNSRKIEDQWFDEFSVQYYHRPLEQIFAEIRKSGFKVVDLREPRPIPEAKDVAPNFYEIHQKIPIFMIFELQKETPIEALDLGSFATRAAHNEVTRPQDQG